MKVQRYRVRESLERVDPGGAAVRAVQSIQRRTYTVAGPNSLWHIDGNHKLIRCLISVLLYMLWIKKALWYMLFSPSYDFCRHY